MGKWLWNGLQELQTQTSLHEPSTACAILTLVQSQEELACAYKLCEQKLTIPYCNADLHSTVVSITGSVTSTDNEISPRTDWARIPENECQRTFGSSETKMVLLETGIFWSESPSQAFFSLFRLEGGSIIIAVFTEHLLSAQLLCDISVLLLLHMLSGERV